MSLTDKPHGGEKRKKVLHPGKPEVVPVKLWLKIQSLKSARKGGKESVEDLVNRREAIANKLNVLEENQSDLKRYYELQLHRRERRASIERLEKDRQRKKEYMNQFRALLQKGAENGEEDPIFWRGLDPLLQPAWEYALKSYTEAKVKLKDYEKDVQELQQLARKMGRRDTLPESDEQLRALHATATENENELLLFITKFVTRYEDLGKASVTNPAIEPVQPVEQQQLPQRQLPPREKVELGITEDGQKEVTQGLTRAQLNVLRACVEITRINEKQYPEQWRKEGHYWFAQQSSVVLHLPLVTLLPLLVEKRDIYIRNLFETGANQGHGSEEGRLEWERKIFRNRAYDALPDHEKVKYGALNLSRLPSGVPSVRKFGYGNCHVVFRKEVKKRCTLTYRDSSYSSVKDIASFLNFGVILSAIRDYSEVAFDYMKMQVGDNPFASPDFDYTEVQIHGELRWDRDIAAVRVPRAIATDQSFLQNFTAFCQILGVDLPLVAFD